MSKVEKIYLDLCSCALFSKLVDRPLFAAFENYVKQKEPDEKLKAYSKFVSIIYTNGGSLTEVAKRLVFEDENIYVKLRAAKSIIPNEISLAKDRELSVLTSFLTLSPSDFAKDMKIDSVASYSTSCCDLACEYEARMNNIHNSGYGIFAFNPMFRLDKDGVLSPIASIDRVSVDSFIGYESERKKVIDNTIALIENRPALNILLYGDAGTGKSSTVKAVANCFYDRGIRLIELRKDQLSSLPEIMAQICNNPLKFIIFIDDLSFNKNDDNFSMLKAALEGSASAKADNAVIYATSNRRHIVKESFEDRSGDDIHRNDTMQEKLSLSERFGLVVLFEKPTKKLYLEIVKELAERNNISWDSSLDIRAEEFALRRGNRSARCAEQFIKSLL